MIKQAIISFNDTSKLGIEKIPNEQFIYVGSLQKFFIKDNNSGLIAGKTIQEAIDTGCLIEAGKRYCNPFSAAMFYNRNILSANLIFISKTGVIVGTELTIGTARYLLVGGNVSTACLFYGGSTDYNVHLNKVTLINTNGTLAQPETNIGTVRASMAAASLGDKLLVFGGETNIQSWTAQNKITILDNTGNLAQAETNAGIVHAAHAGAKSNLNALFYGGYNTLNGYKCINNVTILSNAGVVVQETNNIGSIRSALAGAHIQYKSIFFGGIDQLGTGEWQYQVTIINEDGTLAQAETTISTNTIRGYHAAANVGVNALFYGGGSYGTSLVRNITSLLTITGTLAQTETAVGTGRYGHAGASI